MKNAFNLIYTSNKNSPADNWLAKLSSQNAIETNNILFKHFAHGPETKTGIIYSYLRIGRKTGNKCKKLMKCETCLQSFLLGEKCRNQMLLWRAVI